MKRFLPLVALVSLLALLAVPLWAATATAPASSASDKSPAAPIAGAISTVTGMAISPLLGTGAYGAYQYFKASEEQRAALPWYAQASFWLPALLIVGACAAKDALGAALPPGWKKPLDVLETVENKATGLVAAGAVVPFTMAAVSKMIVGDASTAVDPLVATGVASIHVAAFDVSWLLNILTVPFGIAVFAMVWMASHAINALILLSPWGAIDAVLKSARTAVLGLLTLSSMLNPWISAALSLVIIVIAYFVSGWAFRLFIYGSIFSWDFFTLRRSRYTVKPDENKVFAGGNLPEVPVRTYGRLRQTDSAVVFTYKPWMVLPERSVTITDPTLFVGKGLFFSTVITGKDATYFILPPRYRGHEDELVKAYGWCGVQPAGLRKAWSVLRELFGGSAAKVQVA
ncbi:MAG TPA: hypothetical protein VGD88_02035 [Opitutaceae bacterium]